MQAAAACAKPCAYSLSPQKGVFGSARGGSPRRPRRPWPSRPPHGPAQGARLARFINRANHCFGSRCVFVIRDNFKQGPAPQASAKHRPGSVTSATNSLLRWRLPGDDPTAWQTPADDWPVTGHRQAADTIRCRQDTVPAALLRRLGLLWDHDDRGPKTGCGPSSRGPAQILRPLRSASAPNAILDGSSKGSPSVFSSAARPCSGSSSRISLNLA